MSLSKSHARLSLGDIKAEHDAIRARIEAARPTIKPTIPPPTRTVNVMEEYERVLADPETERALSVCKVCSEWQAGNHCKLLARYCGCGQGSIIYARAKMMTCPLKKWST